MTSRLRNTRSVDPSSGRRSNSESLDDNEGSAGSEACFSSGGNKAELGEWPPAIEALSVMA